MDFTELLSYVKYEHIPLSAVIVRLITAGVSGFIISRIYRLYHKRENASPEMMHSLIFISLIISCAMMIIGNNLASAFGLVGAVSIIRFRTSVKSARDMSFVFFAVVIGMSCGLGYLFIAASGLLLTSAIMMIVYFMSLRGSRTVKSLFYRMKISYKGASPERIMIEHILRDNSEKAHFESMKIDDERTSYTFGIYLTSLQKLEEIIAIFNKSPQLNKLRVTFTAQEYK